MSEEYMAPASTHIGHVHLKVSDLKKSLEFYTDLLGFQITTMYGDHAAFISAGGYHHHIGLNTWQSLNAPPAEKKGVGLFHAAIVYPTRKDLAVIVKRLIMHKYPITGAANHGVSEAIYLDDPDGNGLELYRDLPKTQWPLHPDGTLNMFTRPLNLNDLLKELE